MAIKKRSRAAAADHDPACSSRPRKMMRVVLDSASRSELPYLTPDLIFRILQWLPCKSVFRFRSICKAWRATLSDPEFVGVHLERSKERPSLLMVPGACQDRLNGAETAAFFMGLYKYHAAGASAGAELMHLKEFPRGIAPWTRPLHCNGLILISTQDQEAMICNPATREFVALPKGSTGLLDMNPRVGFGYDPCSNKYKVARFFYQFDFETLYLICKFEVLTLGTDVWRQPADDLPYPIFGRTPVHVKGSIYWTIAVTAGCPDPPRAFIRFSLADEKFSLVPYPPSNLSPARFVELESELGCVCFCSQKLEMEIWTLSVVGQPHINPEWTRRCAMLITTPDLVLRDSHGMATRPPEVIVRGQMLILTGERNVYQYDAQTSKIEQIVSDRDVRSYDRSYDPRYNVKNLELHLTSYAESLLQIREL